jgi:hypothetical protein
MHAQPFGDDVSTGYERVSFPSNRRLHEGATASSRSRAFASGRARGRTGRRRHVWPRRHRHGRALPRGAPERRGRNLRAPLRPPADPRRSFSSNHALLGTKWEPICASAPCTLTLPYGEHTIRFRALGDEGRLGETTIRVTRLREVVNHTLGHERTSPGTLVGGAVIAMSIIALFIPFGTNMGPPAKAGVSQIGTQESNVVFASSVAGAFGGLAVMSFFPNTTQPGATTQWTF